MEPGYTTEVKYSRTVDGDTLVFRIEREFHVRLRDIDVAEKDTVLGQEATEFVSDLLSHASEVLVFIPSNNPEKLMDFNSFSRIVGDVFVDGYNLADILKDNGYEKHNVIWQEELLAKPLAEIPKKTNWQKLKDFWNYYL